jgi:RNA polymerase sigma factor (sigma-70 family)
MSIGYNDTIQPAASHRVSGQEGGTSLLPSHGSVDNASTMEASAARRPIRSGPRIPARLLRLASDDKLVELVRGGSEPAFETVYDRFHRGILAFCRHMLGTPEEAEDAVQHTFMAAYRELMASDKHIHLRPWLYTIARNRCLTVLRARRERPLEDAEEPATEHLAAVVQRRQDLRDLLRDLHELPEQQRAALVLAEAGDVSHAEIGAVLGVPKEKVKALVFQARSSLIVSRQARETDCETIREQLVELKGGSLRRNTLRRHLKECAGCREFRAALQDQRRLLALALPVVPTVALKQTVLGGTVGTGTVAAGAAGGGAAGAGLAGGSLIGSGTSLTAKVLVVAAVAGGGGATAAGVKSVVDDPPAQTAPARGGGADGTGEPAPGPGGSGPQPAGAAAPGAAAEPGGQEGEGAKGDDAAQDSKKDAPETSARPEEAPGQAKGDGENAKPDEAPGQAKEAPVRPDAPGQAEEKARDKAEQTPESGDGGDTANGGKSESAPGQNGQPEQNAKPDASPDQTKEPKVRSEAPAAPVRQKARPVKTPTPAPTPAPEPSGGDAGEEPAASAPLPAAAQGNGASKAGGNGIGKAKGLDKQ